LTTGSDPLDDREWLEATFLSGYLAIHEKATITEATNNLSALIPVMSPSTVHSQMSDAAM
jgi:hypothetical protein